MNHHELIQRLAPLAPPCFASRLQWLSYLLSASQAQNKGEPGPLIFKAGEPVRFDYGMNFCQDCTARWRAEERVEQRGICKPRWLHQFATKEQASCTP